LPGCATCTEARSTSATADSRSCSSKLRCPAFCPHALVVCHVWFFKFSIFTHSC
jgi:hypothetical protein